MKVKFFSLLFTGSLLRVQDITFNSKSRDRQPSEDAFSGGRSSAREQQKADRWNQALEKYSQGRLTDTELEAERQRIFDR